MNPGIDDRQASTPSTELRVLAALIALAVTALVCLIATWPRWHAVITPSPAASTMTSALSSSSSAVPPTLPSSTSSAPSTFVSAAPLAPTAPSGARDASDVTATVAAGAVATAPAAHTGASTASPRGVAGLLRLSPLSASSPNPAEAEAAVMWRNLSDMQRIALGPFASVWDKFSYRQKRKWLAIAAAYPNMPQDAQERLHARMLQWTQMSAEQRTIARENYEMSRALAPSARQQAWRAYQALPPAQKQKLAEAERTHRRTLVVSAPPGGREVPRRHAIGTAPSSGAKANAAEHPVENGSANAPAPAVLGLRRNAVPIAAGGPVAQPTKPAATATSEPTPTGKPVPAPAADTRQRSAPRPMDTNGDADGDAKP